MKNITSVLLIVAILLMINLLSRQFFVRIDVTKDNQYTLSKASKNILRNLDETVMISSYFTSDLPQQFDQTRRDFQDLLEEYHRRSRGMVNYEFIDPNVDAAREQEAVQNGISPLLINVREKDEAVQKKAFMGAIVRAGELEEVIPLIQPDAAMEYSLTTSIKKVSSLDKPSIALIQGHGEPNMNDLSLIQQNLSVLYNVEPLDLNTATEIQTRFKTAILINPADTIPPAHFQIMDDYLTNGGNLCIAFNVVEGNFQTAQGTQKFTGIRDWLNGRGISIEPSFLIDASCGNVSVQQRQGFFTINTAVNFPYFPLVSQFPEHPITKGLEQIVFQFASPLNFTGDSLTQFTPIVETSEQSGMLNTPLYFDIERQWSQADFPMSKLTIGGIVEKREATGLNSKMIVFTDGDFTLGPQGRTQNPDNISLIVNSIDWLSDDTGLIDLRTKGVVTRPIKDLEDTKKATLKWLNFLLPIVLVILYGIYRSHRNRRLRIKRMEESYI